MCLITSGPDIVFDCNPIKQFGLYSDKAIRNNVFKIALNSMLVLSIMFVLRYFDVTALLEWVSSHLDECFFQTFSFGEAQPKDIFIQTL